MKERDHFAKGANASGLAEGSIHPGSQQSAEAIRVRPATTMK
jgi:hypothetical protein